VQTFEDIYRDRQLDVLDMDRFMKNCIGLIKDEQIRNARFLDFIDGKPDIYLPR